MRAGIEDTLSAVVSEILGLRIRLSNEGRQRDGRFCYSDSQKSQCAACTVAYLKEHVASETDYCACRKSNSHIQMVKSAEEWRLHNAANGMNSAR